LLTNESIFNQNSIFFSLKWKHYETCCKHGILYYFHKISSLVKFKTTCLYLCNQESYNGILKHKSINEGILQSFIVVYLQLCKVCHKHMIELVWYSQNFIKKIWRVNLIKYAQVLMCYIKWKRLITSRLIRSSVLWLS